MLVYPTCYDCKKPISDKNYKRCYPCSMKAKTVPIHIRFWKYVKKTPSCWLWTGSKSHGYGSLYYRSKGFRASHISWEIHKGLIPDGFWLLHKCDNPPCVNPDHLFLGTQKDNMQDCANKKRTTIGEKNSRAILSKKQVLWIKSNYIKRHNHASIMSKRFGVSRQAIYDIIYGRRWSHV